MFEQITQGTEEWKRLRIGKVTASRIADVTARTKSGYAASRANYMAELLTERLTGVPRESFSNAAMVWGSDMEPEARRHYAFITDNDVAEVAFVEHPTIANTGASPDGLVGADGLVEIKCPSSATHIETLLGSGIDGKYIKQMQWQMACTGREYCDFVSFDPRLPERMQIHVERVKADGEMIREIEAAVREFLSELDAKEAALLEKFGELPTDLLMAGE